MLLIIAIHVSSIKAKYKLNSEVLTRNLTKL